MNTFRFVNLLGISLIICSTFSWAASFHNQGYLGSIGVGLDGKSDFFPAETLPAQDLPWHLSRSTNPVDTSKFSAPCLALLRKLSGTMSEVLFDRNEVLEVRYAKYVAGDQVMVTIHPEGITAQGKVLSINKQLVLTIPDSLHQLILIGPLVKENSFLSWIALDDLILEGIPERNGEALRLTRVIRPRRSAEQSQTLILGSIRAATLANGEIGHFIKSLEHEPIWLNARSVTEPNLIDDDLNPEVIITGRGERELFVESIRLVGQSLEGANCADSLLADLLAKHKTKTEK
jgi:hypothetical protein